MAQQPPPPDRGPSGTINTSRASIHSSGRRGFVEEVDWSSIRSDKMKRKAGEFSVGQPTSIFGGCFTGLTDSILWGKNLPKYGGHIWVLDISVVKQRKPLIGFFLTLLSFFLKFWVFRRHSFIFGGIWFISGGTILTPWLDDGRIRPNKMGRKQHYLKNIMQKL